VSAPLFAQAHYASYSGGWDPALRPDLAPATADDVIFFLLTMAVFFVFLSVVAVWRHCLRALRDNDRAVEDLALKFRHTRP